MSTHTSKAPILLDNGLNKIYMSKKSEPKRNSNLPSQRTKSSTSNVGTLSKKNESK